MAASGLFRGSQMVEMAIQMEQDGRAFYLAAADVAAASEVSTICRALADDELEHEQTFRNMLDEAQGSNTWGESYRLREARGRLKKQPSSTARRA